MVLVAYAGPVRPAAALRDSVLCLPTDIHSLFVNKPSSSSSSSSSSPFSPGHGRPGRLRLDSAHPLFRLHPTPDTLHTPHQHFVLPFTPR